MITSCLRKGSSRGLPNNCMYLCALTRTSVVFTLDLFPLKSGIEQALVQPCIDNSRAFPCFMLSAHENSSLTSDIIHVGTWFDVVLVGLVVSNASTRFARDLKGDGDEAGFFVNLANAFPHGTLSRHRNRLIIVFLALISCLGRICGIF